MDIRKIHVDRLIAATYNPRKDLKKSDPEYKKLKKSIEKFDYIDPIIWNEQTGNVVGGHQRLKVLKDLGYTEIDVSVVNLPIDEEKALNIGLNKIGGEFDEEMLASLMDELRSLEVDMDLTGFDAVDIDSMLHTPEQQKEVVEDEFDVEANLSEQPNAQYGDVYQLGRHRLMCGDSTSESDVSVLMNGNKVDLFFTSPPYGVNLDYNSYKDTFENTFNLVNNVLPVISKFVSDYIVLNWGDIVSASKINGTKHPSQFSWLPVYNDILNKSGWYLWAQRIWTKPHARCSGVWSASSNRPVSDWEYIFTWAKESPSYNERANGSHFGVIDSSDSSQTGVLADHPGAFPIVVSDKVIQIHTKEQSTVFDCFGGTGTTLIASEQNNRTCYMMEIDPKYVDVIIKRWETFTGQKAIKVR